MEEIEKELNTVQESYYETEEKLEKAQYNLKYTESNIVIVNQEITSTNEYFKDTISKYNDYLFESKDSVFFEDYEMDDYYDIEEMKSIFGNAVETLDNINNVKKDITSTRDKISKEKLEIEKLKKELATKKAEIESLKIEKDRLIEKLKKDQVAYQNNISNLKKQKAQIDKQIVNIINAEIKKQKAKEAAAIMRGEKTLEDITYDYKNDVGNYYGKPIVRPNAMAKACGVCDYGDDVELKMPAETLKVALVMPRITNHAKIISIDYSEAEKMPGVVKVITAKDIEGANRLMMFQFSPRTTAFDQVHKLLNDETIVNWGNVVAMVAADTKEHAREAAAKVKVEIEQLPEYMSYLDAVMPDAKRVHPNMDNIYAYQPLLKGDADKVPDMIDDAPYAVEGSFYSSREPHMSIEGDTVQAYIDEDGKICPCIVTGKQIGRAHV